MPTRTRKSCLQAAEGATIDLASSDVEMPPIKRRFVSSAKDTQNRHASMAARESAGNVLVLDQGWNTVDALLGHSIEPERIFVANNNPAHYQEMRDHASEGYDEITLQFVDVAAFFDEPANAHLQKQGFSVIDLDLCCKGETACRVLRRVLDGKYLRMCDLTTLSVTFSTRGCRKPEVEATIDELSDSIDMLARRRHKMRIAGVPLSTPYTANGSSMVWTQFKLVDL